MKNISAIIFIKKKPSQGNMCCLVNHPPTRLNNISYTWHEEPHRVLQTSSATFSFWHHINCTEATKRIITSQKNTQKRRVVIIILTMAAISITRNAMLNLAKAFFPQSPSLFPNSSSKVSRVSFTTSASKYNEVKNSFNKLIKQIYMGIYRILRA